MYLFLQLLIEAGFEQMLPKFEEHFHNVLKCASKLQSEILEELAIETPLSLNMEFSVEKFGEEMLKCMETLPACNYIQL